MKLNITQKELTQFGFEANSGANFINQINTMIENSHIPQDVWKLISKKILTSDYAFPINLFLFSLIYPNWHSDPESAPAFIPDDEDIRSANITYFMSRLGINKVKDFHKWSHEYPEKFWQEVTHQLQIKFDAPYTEICDLSQGIDSPDWFKGGQLNIANSCFHSSSSATAIIYENKNKELVSLSYDELNRLSNRIANSLVQQGLTRGDAIGIVMPMNHYAVAVYLGIIKMGGVVVSIADSFSAEEIALRLNIAKAIAIFTQDFIPWGKKKIPLYEKIKKSCSLPSELNELKIFVIPFDEDSLTSLRDNDYTFKDFLVTDDEFTAVPCSPMSPCNILFSSGTTGTPKAIAWNHTTPIKAASDAYFHHNIKPGDVFAWPTNLGWMMGPWLLFASFIHKATIALYPDSPKEKAFGEFIERSKVNLLGVIPTLVASWRQSQCMEKLDWSNIKVFSSTGECSNPEDSLYLMWLAGYKPVIEYCGGTEIGGAYLSSTVVDNNYPSLFTTPTMGLDILILDEHGIPANIGEVAIIPPSIGLSTSLLNADHYQVYFANMPDTSDGKKLRRHGDEIKKLPRGNYILLGRVDDTMNLGGIKISAVEIERILSGFKEITEVAAIATYPSHGRSVLVIYAATESKLNKNKIMKEMQTKINTDLNPLFKIHDVVFIKELPKTASNKIMRRILREKYYKSF